MIREMVPMCQDQRPCPSAVAPDGLTAHVVMTHYDQGWSQLCKGSVVFDDLGSLLVDGRSVDPGYCQPAQSWHTLAA
jgi:hypothetical protein